MATNSNFTGAERFATYQNIPLVSNESLVTSRAKQALDNFHKSSNDPLSTHEGTIETNELDDDDDTSKPNSKVRPFSPEI